MEITVLGASGATGRELTRQALERGHTVVAIVRDVGRLPDFPGLIGIKADVRDLVAMAAALEGRAIVLSALGVTRGDQARVLPVGDQVGAAPVGDQAGAPPVGERVGVLTAGARAVVAARPERVVWLGAYGTGPSARAAGPLTRSVLRLLGDRDDKVTADALVLGAGGTVFHAGPLTTGPLSSRRRTVGLRDAPRRIFPAAVSRATVAAAMLDEAESPAHAGGVALPLAG